MATSGPGAIHLLNGLYDAKLDHQPVVAMVGQTFATVMEGDQQQEVDLLSLYKDVASTYVLDAVRRLAGMAREGCCVDRFGAGGYSLTPCVRPTPATPALWMMPTS